MRRQMVGLAALAKAEPKGLVKVPGPLLSICWPDPAHGIRGRIAGPAKGGGRLLYAFSVVVARIGFSATTSRESRQGRKAAAAAMMSGAGVPADTGHLHALRPGFCEDPRRARTRKTKRRWRAGEEG